MRFLNLNSLNNETNISSDCSPVKSNFSILNRQKLFEKIHLDDFSKKQAIQNELDAFIKGILMQKEGLSGLVIREDNFTFSSIFK
jgi:hypothetical protein